VHRDLAPPVVGWEPGIHIPTGGEVAFTGDDRIMAVPVAFGVLALVDPTTGCEYVRLEDPNQDHFDWCTFTANGTHLITSSSLGQAIHAWDLRLIRQQLAGLGLDWEGPPFRPTGETPDNHVIPTSPAEVEARGMDLVTNPEKMKQYEHVQDMLALVMNPFDAEAHFRVGKELLAEGQAAEAFTRFTFALTFRRGFGAAHVGRAKAAVRMKRWADAITDADIVLARLPADPDTLALRGQTYQQLERHTEAVADFTAALARIPNWRELHELRAASYTALGKKVEAAADRR
jgi:tetratricopeptide (TPR) repeat protein